MSFPQRTAIKRLVPEPEVDMGWLSFYEVPSRLPYVSVR
jgi:hypothetical protein